MKTRFKYTQKIRNVGGGWSWRFSPPTDVIKAGVSRSMTFRDGRTAMYAIPKELEAIEAYRRGELAAGTVGRSSTLAQVIAHYKETRLFENLSLNSKLAYELAFNNIVSTPLGSITFGMIKIKNITARMCTIIYEVWSKLSIPSANTNARIFSVVMSYCVSLDMLMANPMTKVRKLRHTPRSEVWTQEQVKQFLEVAFSQFKWRNVGLLAYMMYEWCQRPVDIRHLKWSNFNEGTVKIVQRKRGATVELPVNKSLMTMLDEQKEDYGFQDYVVPYLRKGDNAYRPYTIGCLNKIVNDILAEAGLPKDLRIGELRKTGIVELVDAGVDSIMIMSVSGHKNISGLNPYMKHTLTAATKALEMRRR